MCDLLSRIRSEWESEQSVEVTPWPPFCDDSEPGQKHTLCRLLALSHLEERLFSVVTLFQDHGSSKLMGSSQIYSKPKKKKKKSHFLNKAVFAWKRHFKPFRGCKSCRYFKKRQSQHPTVHTKSYFGRSQDKEHLKPII